MTNNITLPIVLRAEVLGEIMAFQTGLYKEITGDFPSGEEMDMVAKSSATWLEKMIRLLQPSMSPSHDEMPDSEADQIFQHLAAKLHEQWREIRTLQAQLFGLSEDTARQLIDYLHSKANQTAST